MAINPPTLRRLVLAACEDLGRYGLEPSQAATAAVAALIVNASRLGSTIDSGEWQACPGCGPPFIGQPTHSASCTGYRLAASEGAPQ
jgi:hypothetical protein